MILHRYIKDEWGIDIIKKLRIHLSNPFNLNDPFEFEVAVAKGNIGALKKNLKDKNYIDHLYENYDHNEKNKKEFKQKMKKLRQNEEKLQEMLEKLSTEGKKTLKAEGNKHFKTMGLLCFVSPEKTNNEKQQKYDEILMWSHYAKSHEELRFHFEKNEFDFISESFHEIKYKNEMCQIDPYKSDTWEKTLRDSLITKSKAWEYENEYRYFIHTMECQKEDNNYYIDIPANSIKRIDIGLKCSKKIQNEVIQLIREKNELQHVNLFKANIHESKYELIYDKLQIDQKKFL